ncbi:hypothetical protein GCM10010279_50290 [Streptomyces mutabilis]|nr:hypothetical protein GCM10010279_50290 [Streptomyces mutabilis]
MLPICRANHGRFQGRYENRLSSVRAVPREAFPDDGCTGRHSSTADAAAAWTGVTVAVVNLYATTSAEVSRWPRPRLWR